MLAILFMAYFVWLSAGEDRLSICQFTLTIIVLIPRTNPAGSLPCIDSIEVSVESSWLLAVVAFWPRNGLRFQRSARRIAFSQRLLALAASYYLSTGFDGTRRRFFGSADRFRSGSNKDRAGEGRASERHV